MKSSKYRKNGEDAGSLGIIGPMRVDYKKIIPYIEYLTGKISDRMSGDDNITVTEADDSRQQPQKGADISGG